MQFIIFITVISFYWTKIITTNVFYPLSFPSSTTQPAMDFQTFNSLSLDKNLTFFQTQSLFILIDQNKDGRVDVKEWNSFYELFIDPYEEKCDSDHQYNLNLEGFQKCIQSVKALEPLKNVENLKKIIKMLGSNENSINFYHYILLRRYSFAWKSCLISDKKSLNINEFSCAISYVLDFADQNRIEVNHLFYIATHFSGKSKNKNLKTVTFEAFVYITANYARFLALQNGVNKDQVDLNQITDGFQEGLLDMKRINLTMVQKIFGFFSKQDEEYIMDFKTFFHWNKAVDDIEEYGKNSEEKNSDDENLTNKKLTLEGFKKVIEDSPIDINELYERCKQKIIKENDEDKKIDENEEKNIEKNFDFDFEVVSLLEVKKKQDFLKNTTGFHSKSELSDILFEQFGK